MILEAQAVNLAAVSRDLGRLRARSHGHVGQAAPLGHRHSVGVVLVVEL